MPPSLTPPSFAIEPEALLFADDGFVPNNPRLLFVIYRGAIDGNTPMSTPFDDPRGHGIARGKARVRFGGNEGRPIELTQGDVTVLPAGIGHQLPVAQQRPVAGRCRSADRLVRSLPGQQGRPRQGRAVDPEVPLPDTDPVFGKSGPLLRLWGN